MNAQVKFFSATYSDQNVVRSLRVPEYERLTDANPTYLVVIISKNSGSFKAGVYVNRGSRWLFALPYEDTGIAFGGDYNLQIVINPTSEVVAVSGTLIYRNGYLTPLSTVPVTNEVVWSVLTPKICSPESGGGSGGGGGGGGGAGTVDSYEHQQSVASSVWEITHSLNKYPSVTILDSTNEEIVGGVTHISKNSVLITFSAAITGRAIFN